MFVVGLVFSALISISYLEQILSILLSRASSACSTPATALMSSANRRSVIAPSPMLFFCHVLQGHLSRKKKLKRVSERRQPRDNREGFWSTAVDKPLVCVCMYSAYCLIEIMYCDIMLQMLYQQNKVLAILL